MSTTSLSPVTPTTSAQQEGAAMSTAQQADEIEVLRVLMSRYAQWGDTQQWDKVGSRSAEWTYSRCVTAR